MLRLDRPARHEGGLVHQMIVIIGVSVLSGVLMAALALPWVGLLNKGAEQSAQAVENFPLQLRFQALDERTIVLDSRGNRLATFYDENRKYVTLDKISRHMQSAIISIEDSRFYDHGAIDIKGTLRALVTNSLSGGVVQGGSTITQQLVKLTRLDNASNAKEADAATEETKARKIEELRYAVWVEDHMNKDKILEHYLNIAYYGDGAYGIEAAAHHYFATTAAALTVRQSAMLAGLVKNPTSYNPTSNPRQALNRRNTVLDRMLELHVLTTKQAKKARNSPLDLNVKDVPNGCVNTNTPWFCDYLLNYLLADRDLGAETEARKRLVYGGGLTITTTVDQRFQRAADKSVTNHVLATDSAIGGLAMVEPGTGYVRALSQSRPMGNKKRQGETFLDYVVPKRLGDSNGFQPGSTFKPFVLAAALTQGIPLNKTIYSPATITVNEGDYRTCDGYYPSTQSYTLSNSTDSGTMNLYTGTRLSVNTFYVQLEQLTGLCQPWRLAKRMGVEIERDPTPSYTLGVEDASPLEMAEAYATFAARGIHCAATPVLEIRDRNGDVIPTGGPQCERVLKQPVADAINDVLRGVIEGGFAEEQALNQDAAGKTGTVQDQAGVWFMGYTANLATASMIAGANQLGQPVTLQGKTIAGELITDATGSGTAAPMWGDAMKVIQQWLPDETFVPPNPTQIEGQTVSIPSFYGVAPATAAQRLTQLGFKPAISSSVYSTAPYGTVAYTTPSYQGTSGETVQIFTSNGSPPPTQAPPPAPAPSTQPPSSGTGAGPTGGGGGPTGTGPTGAGPTGGAPTGGGTPGGNNGNRPASPGGLTFGTSPGNNGNG